MKYEYEYEFILLISNFKFRLESVKNNDPISSSDDENNFESPIVNKTKIETVKITTKKMVNLIEYYLFLFYFINLPLFNRFLLLLLLLRKLQHRKQRLQSLYQKKYKSLKMQMKMKMKMKILSLLLMKILMMNLKRRTKKLNFQ